MRLLPSLPRLPPSLPLMKAQPPLAAPTPLPARPQKQREDLAAARLTRWEASWRSQPGVRG